MNNWKKEFDKRFVEPYPIDDPSVDCRIIKEWIEDLLSSQLKEVLKAIENELDPTKSDLNGRIHFENIKAEVEKLV